MRNFLLDRKSSVNSCQCGNCRGTASDEDNITCLMLGAVFSNAEIHPQQTTQNKQMASSPHHRDGEAIAKIEIVIQGIVDSLAKEDTISIPLRVKKNATSSTSAGRDSVATTNYTNVSWPAKTQAEAKRFSMLSAT